jgi:hypothetical protein
VTRKNTNPNWSRGLLIPLRGTQPTAFELQAEHLGLESHDWATSSELRHWCERNGDRVYVPEWLLKAWGIVIDPVNRA